MERTIHYKQFLPYPVEDVWNFLTDPELLSEWLMPNDFKAVVGHSFQFKTKSRIGFDGNIYCQVLELNPLCKLSYMWRGGPGNGKITLDSVVTWTLIPAEGGTDLLLEHKGFRGFGNLLAYLVMSKGWARIVGKRLLQRVNHTAS